MNKMSRSENEADIMLIADTSADTFLLTQILADNGYDFRQAASASEAFAGIAIKKPDLIMLADQVAGTDGFDICKKLISAPGTKTKPVIILVGQANTLKKIAGLPSGRVDFIKKPYQHDEVLIQVKNSLAMYFLNKKFAQRNRSLLNEIEGQKETEMLLQLERDRLKTIVQAIGDGVIYTNIAGKITMMNEAAKNFTGWLMEDAVEEPVDKVFRIISASNREKYDDPVKQALQTARPYAMEESVILVSKDGNEILIEAGATPVFLNQGKIDGAVLIFRNYAKERKKLKKTDFLNHYDQINGRYNRRNSDNELRRLGENRYLPYAFVIADVNGLGLTNSVLGNKYSELLLKKLTNILKTECRPDDIVVRIGDSKFVVFMPSCDAKYADILINRLNKSVASQNIRNVVFSLSFDFSLNSDIYNNNDAVLIKAEEEMSSQTKTAPLSVKSKIVFIVMNALFMNNITEKTHAQSVSAHSVALAKTMGIAEEGLWQVKLAAMLHDIGKIGVNELILDSTVKLAAEQWEAIRRHPETGYRILASSYEFSDIAGFILEHHERWDGTGYPRGLRGNEISLQARIISVADTYDDIISERTYKRKLHKEDAILELKRCAGSQFDPEITRAFIEKVLCEEWSEKD